MPELTYLWTVERLRDRELSINYINIQRYEPQGRAPLGSLAKRSRVMAFGKIAITDGRYHGAGDERADAGSGYQLAATLAALRQNLDLFGDVLNTLIKMPPIGVEMFYDHGYAV